MRPIDVTALLLTPLSSTSPYVTPPHTASLQPSLLLFPHTHCPSLLHVSDTLISTFSLHYLFSIILLVISFFMFLKHYLLCNVFSESPSYLLNRNRAFFTPFSATCSVKKSILYGSTTKIFQLLYL